jgi:hypothetical protein
MFNTVNSNWVSWSLAVLERRTVTLVGAGGTTIVWPEELQPASKMAELKNKSRERKSKDWKRCEKLRRACLDEERE